MAECFASNRLTTKGKNMRTIETTVYTFDELNEAAQG